MVDARELGLSYTPPFNWEGLIDFLSVRATPGVELVSAGVYRRTFELGGSDGTLAVGRDDDRSRLVVRTSRRTDASALKRRLERLFDLDADSSAIAETLAADPLLAPLVREFPGIRVPGSWDPFETAVRAIIGQVVSVKVATTLTGRLAARYGKPIEDQGNLINLYPTPGRLAEADLSGLGLSQQKIRSIRALARAAAAGDLRFEELTNLEDALERLQQLPGVGSWTAHYIAMRALGQRDAFPAGDLILRRAAAKDGGTSSEKQLETVSQRWRPYRAYAAMLLWASYARSMRERKESA